MALFWDWNKKIGEMEVAQTHENDSRRLTFNLYNGNACLIMIYEWTELDGKEKYNLHGFFVDIQHMKNCLGLNKKGGYEENIYFTPYERAVKFRFSKKCRDLKKIVPLIVEAFDNIDIEIYTEEEK